MIKNLKQNIKKLRIRKKHIDWIAGLLSIPLLLTVITLNLTNLNSQKNNNDGENPQPTEKVIVIPQEKNSETQPTQKNCKEEIGPISIISPRENEEVLDNPVNILIRYNNPDYCSVVWSYRINGGAWSEYNNTSPSLYNLPSGNIKFDLRIQSTVSSDSESLTRNFIYSPQPLSPTETPPITPISE